VKWTKYIKSLGPVHDRKQSQINTVRTPISPLLKCVSLTPFQKVDNLKSWLKRNFSKSLSGSPQERDDVKRQLDTLLMGWSPHNFEDVGTENLIPDTVC